MQRELERQRELEKEQMLRRQLEAQKEVCSGFFCF